MRLSDPEQSSRTASERSVAPHAGLVRLIFWLLGGLLLASIVLPLVGLATFQSPDRVARVAAMPEVWSAIALSLAGASVTALIAGFFGFPLAYVLAHSRFRGKRLVEAVIDLPLAVPHTVAGIALLFVYGRRGMLGVPLRHTLGLQFWGTFAGIVVAMLFVSAPYAVNAARIGFASVDPRLEKTGRTLGVGPWGVLARVTLPLAWPSLLTGMSLTFARAISEFGAVVILAYYPMTAPVRIYELFLRFGVNQAAGMALIVLIIVLVLFVGFRYLPLSRGKRPDLLR